MAGVDEVEVVVAHSERATLRVGDVFLKVDGHPTRTEVEVQAMAMAPIPTPEVLWRLWGDAGRADVMFVWRAGRAFVGGDAVGARGR